MHVPLLWGLANHTIALSGQKGRIYVMNIRFEWDEAKRLRNLSNHGLDFVDTPAVFEGRTVSYEDDRFDYGEERFVTLGSLNGMPVSIIHTETETEIHIISFRRATKREAAYLYENS